MDLAMHIDTQSPQNPDSIEPIAEVEEIVKNLGLSDAPLEPGSPPVMDSPPSPIIKPNDRPMADLKPKPGFRATKTFTPPKTTQTETRARAEEVQNAKLVPRIESSPPELLPFPIELEAFLCNVGTPITHLLKPRDGDTETAKKLKQLLNIDSDPKQVQASSLQALDEGWLEKLVLTIYPNDLYTHCLLYVLLLSHCHSNREPLLLAGVPLIPELFRSIADQRWVVDDEDESSPASASSPTSSEYSDTYAGMQSKSLLTRLFSLLRISLLATFGSSPAHFEAVRSSVWSDVFGLPEDANEVSPQHYSEFVQNVLKRYPGALKEVSGVHKLAEHLHQTSSADESRQDPGQLVQGANNGVMPYIPRSITEACDLLAEHATFTPKMVELQLEVDIDKNWMKRPISEISDDFDVSIFAPAEQLEKKLKSVPHINCFFKVYTSTLGIQKSFFRVVVDFLMQQIKRQKSLFGIRSALNACRILLKWASVSHALMFEHYTALLFDCQFLITADFLCATNSDILGALLEPYEETGLWVYPDLVMKWMPDRAQLALKHYNAINLQTYTSLVSINRSIVSERVQRLVFAASLQVDTYKQLLSVYEKGLWNEVLLYVKDLVPYIGKKWRYMNMELISAIYMHCPTTLDENWMSGTGVLRLIQNASKQEYVLRNLVSQFNLRRDSYGKDEFI